MGTDLLLEAIECEITKLQQARDLIASTSNHAKLTITTVKPKAIAKAKTKQPKKRHMSPEGKARIAAAQKKRWAAVNKTK